MQTAPHDVVPIDHDELAAKTLESLDFSPENPSARIIGICGQRGAGKDTFARFLAGKLSLLLDEEVLTVPFAKSIKEFCCDHLGFSSHQIEDRALKEISDPRLGFSPRTAMQTVGQSLRDLLRQDIWILSNGSPLRKALAPHRPIVIVPDTRYRNEREVIHAVGGYLVGVSRPSSDRATHDPCIDLHPSETEVWDDPEPSYIVRNQGGLSELHYEAIVLAGAVKSLWSGDAGSSSGGFEIPELLSDLT